MAVQVEYRIAPERQAAFRAAIAPLGEIRRRDGATVWGVFTDAEDPLRVVEWFVLASWAEHLPPAWPRHGGGPDGAGGGERAPREGPAPPRVTHLIGLRRGDAGDDGSQGWPRGRDVSIKALVPVLVAGRIAS